MFDTADAWAEIKSGEVFNYIRPSSESGDYNNINDTLSYIQNKNVGLTREKASENILAVSGGLSLASHSEKSYIEGKLSRMSISNGADYLMGKGK